jgi:hypothetical protein
MNTATQAAELDNSDEQIDEILQEELRESRPEAEKREEELDKKFKCLLEESTRESETREAGKEEELERFFQESLRITQRKRQLQWDNDVHRMLNKSHYQAYERVEEYEK